MKHPDGIWPTCTNKCTNAFLQAKCRASMRPVTYNVNAQLIRGTGMVRSGECSCKAGQSGVCAHVGALLLTLVNVREACTPHTCEWKAATCNVKVEPQRCEAIRIYNPEKDVREKCRPYTGIYSAGPKVDPGVFVKYLLDALQSCNSDCALYLTLRAKPGNISDFLSLFDIQFNFADTVTLTGVDTRGTFQKFCSTSQAD